jgi:hypothetical protein
VAARWELDKVAEELVKYTEVQYVARANFYQALILLGDKRPSAHLFQTMRAVDSYMQAALDQYKTRTYLRTLGLFKLDFSWDNNILNYEEEAQDLLNEASRFPHMPEDTELFAILTACQADLIADYETAR